MRRIVILCSILALMTGRAFAQNTNNLDYIKKVEKFRRMRNAGAGLTVVGSVLLVVGTVTVINSSVDELFYTESKTTDAGVASMVAGQICLGAGIPLWIVGANNHKKYSKLAQGHGLNVKINATPQSRGLTFTYRF